MVCAAHGGARWRDELGTIEALDARRPRKVAAALLGEEALVICSKESFDIIVVDQYMEEAGGGMVSVPQPHLRCPGQRGAGFP